MDLPSLPFSIPHVYEGLANAKGIVRVESAELILEFEVKDGFVGMIKSGVREVRIPFDDLADLELHKGWFSTKLSIRTRRMTASSRIPGSDGTMAQLHLSRRDRQTAEVLVSTLLLNLSERQLARSGQPQTFV
jgi:hypothetical protein